MTHCRQVMLEELQRRNFAPTTISSYLHAVEQFARHFKCRPDRLNQTHFRSYQAYLLRERKMQPLTVRLHVAALRFFFVKTLKRRYLLDDTPYPKAPRRLPQILSVEEVARVIDAADSLSHRTMLMVLYSTGMRNAELRHLQVADIDSRRMLIHIQRGKGGRDRYVPLSPTLLTTLRVYYRWMRPKTWLFPGTVDGWRADKPITPKVLWEACVVAARRAGLRKRCSPHLVRHSYATHLLESGADLRTIQLLLGHVEVRHTVLYLHLSRTHLQAVASPVIRKYSVQTGILHDFVTDENCKGAGAGGVACFGMRQHSSSSIVCRTIGRLLVDALRFVSLGCRSRAQLAAENLFLRKQLALYRERRVKSRRADDATRITLVVLSQLIDWRAVLTIVKPDTLIRWHRRGFRLFWRWKSRARGRPPLPVDLQQLIAAMARANVTWGEERIAAELHLKLGLRVSPRTVRRYIQGGRPRDRRSSHQWSTFVRNHAGAMLACDFFVTITATFRTLYVFVVLDVGTRRIVHWNATEHPTAEWTIQQFRAIVPGDQLQRFLIHDRDRIYSAAVDGAVEAMGLTVLKTPVRCPQANAFCERLIGTIRRECLDWLILVNERHLRSMLREWVPHYNHGRPHASLGPSMPDGPLGRLAQQNGHRIPGGQRVIATPILAGLHHEYRLERLAA